MANVKISALPAITSSDDLASADIVPVVDNSDSTTKKVSLSVLNNFFGGTLSEGTFTPTLRFDSGSVTLSTAEGYYARIGNLVYITIKLILSALSSPIGAMTIGALPVTTADNTGGGGIGGVVATKLKFQTNIGYIPNATNIVVRAIKNTTTAKISFSDDNVAYFDATADSLNADTEIQSSFFYIAG